MEVIEANDRSEWDDFLARQSWTPFLQSWTMGEVYKDTGQKTVRLTAKEGTVIRGICFAHLVPARRGRHLSVPYGPIIDRCLDEQARGEVISGIVSYLKSEAMKHECTFVRLSPFWTEGTPMAGTVFAPLHMLAEHVWYLPLKTDTGATREEEEILMQMRKTTRNLIRRAERDGVTVTASPDPVKDMEEFLRLHEETRKRHKFTPYSDAFFRAQVKHFASEKQCTVYLAHFQGSVIAASIHIHAFGETSYHHGASSSAHHKIPASYLLQWTAIKDSLRRGDRIYNFWGIAPLDVDGNVMKRGKDHPFAGVTLFKTGFGGKLMNLVHCTDVPVKASYWLTYGFEKFRKWRRGF